MATNSFAGMALRLEDDEDDSGQLQPPWLNADELAPPASAPQTQRPTSATPSLGGISGVAPKLESVAAARRHSEVEPHSGGGVAQAGLHGNSAPGGAPTMVSNFGRHVAAARAASRAASPIQAATRGAPTRGGQPSDPAQPQSPDSTRPSSGADRAKAAPEALSAAALSPPQARSGQKRPSISLSPPPSPRLAASGRSGGSALGSYAEAAAAAALVSRRLPLDAGAAAPTASSLARSRGAARSSLSPSPLSRLATGGRPASPRAETPSGATRMAPASRGSDQLKPSTASNAALVAPAAAPLGRVADASTASSYSGARSPRSVVAAAAPPPSTLSVHPERLRAEAVVLRADVSRLTSQVASLEADLASARERAVEAEARGRMLSRRVASLEAEDAAVRHELASLRGGAAHDPAAAGGPPPDSAADAIRAEVCELRSELASLGRDLAAAVKGRDEARAELGAVEAALRVERGSGAVVAAAHNVVARASAASADAAAKQRAVEEARGQVAALRAELEAQKAMLSGLRSERDAQLRSFESQAAAARADVDGLQRTAEDFRAQVRSLESQLAAARADKETLLRTADTQAAAARAERDAQQRTIEALQRALDDSQAKVAASHADRDSQLRTADAQLAAFKKERDAQLRSHEAQMFSLRAEKNEAERSVSALQRLVDDLRAQAASALADKESTATQAAQAAARAREASQLDAQKKSREQSESLSLVQSALDSERQRRLAAEWAVEHARSDLERATLNHASELQSLTAAAGRRADALQAEVSRLERSLGSATSLQEELRAQLASAEERGRAATSSADLATEQLASERARNASLQTALDDRAKRLAVLETAASTLAPLEAAVAALQDRVAELQASGERRADEAARDLRLCQAQVRELEESAADATVEARELRVELERALASSAQFREALESEHDRSEGLQRDVAQLRAALKQPQTLPDDVVRSLTESREAIAELTRSLREQEAMTAALRAECNAYRDSADTASDAAHGAMVAALRAQRAAGGADANRRRPQGRSWGGGGSSSASVRSESLSPTSTAASRVMQNGEMALASAAAHLLPHRVAGGVGQSWQYDDRSDGSPAHGSAADDRESRAGMASGAATTIARLRATIASRDATIAALRSECSELGGQIAALQAELAVYRKVDVYSVTLHKEMKAMSSRHVSGLPIGGH